MSTRKPTLWLLPLIVCLTLFVSVSHGLAATDTVQQKKKELQGVEKQIQKRKANIFLFQRQEKSVLKQLNKNEQELEKTRRRLTDLYSQTRNTEVAIQRTAAELRIAITELEKAETKLRERVDTLGKRLRAFYIRGPGDYLELLFTSADFGDFISRMDMLERIVNQDIVLFNEVKAEKESVERQRKSIEEKKATLEQKRDVLKKLAHNVSQEEGRISEKKREREYYLKEVRSKKELEEKALDELEQVAEDLSSMIEKMLAKNKGKVIPTDSGKMTWPAVGRVTSPFGWRMHPIFHKRKYHSGIDIGAKNKSPIVAARNGVVLFQGWYSGYGKIVIIDHGGGISTAYAHCSTILVSAGQKVSRGQTIARVGSTGYSTGPHLHFEVRVGAERRNPMDWLP